MDLVYGFLYLKCIIKQLAIRFGFCDMQNYQCLDKSYQPRLQLVQLHLDIDNSAYHKNLIQ